MSKLGPGYELAKKLKDLKSESELAQNPKLPQNPKPKDSAALFNPKINFIAKDWEALTPSQKSIYLKRALEKEVRPITEDPLIAQFLLYDKEKSAPNTLSEDATIFLKTAQELHSELFYQNSLNHIFRADAARFHSALGKAMWKLCGPNSEANILVSAGC